MATIKLTEKDRLRLALVALAHKFGTVGADVIEGEGDPELSLELDISDPVLRVALSRDVYINVTDRKVSISTNGYAESEIDEDRIDRESFALVYVEATGEKIYRADYDADVLRYIELKTSLLRVDEVKERNQGFYKAGFRGYGLKWIPVAYLPEVVETDDNAPTDDKHLVFARAYVEALTWAKRHDDALFAGTAAIEAMENSAVVA